MRLKLHVWRQSGPNAKGAMETYELDGVTPESSFLEMIDLLNEKLLSEGKDPVAFEHDCREGICGMCSMVVNGHVHGPDKAVTTCQVHMRSFKDGDDIYIEPFRAKAFPVLKDLVVDRSSLDRIIQAGGYVSVGTGGTPDANEIPITTDIAERAMDAAACIGCGACVAACPNASAMLFTAAKVSHLGQLPQGQVEREKRARDMVEQMDAEGFGNCTNHYECMEACPKEIDVEFIARMNRDYLKASLAAKE
jgi:succinate dehydrogenase / fumarate reductase iron-sulfur subunit